MEKSHMLGALNDSHAGSSAVAPSMYGRFSVASSSTYTCVRVRVRVRAKAKAEAKVRVGVQLHVHL